MVGQEFLPENPEEESPFGSLDASELEEVFEDSGVPRIEIDALKVALRWECLMIGGWLWLQGDLGLLIMELAFNPLLKIRK